MLMRKRFNFYCQSFQVKKLIIKYNIYKITRKKIINIIIIKKLKKKILMLNLPANKKHQLYKNPITMMRQFYYQYPRQKNQNWLIKNDKNILLKHTLSMSKFNQCLEQLKISTNRSVHHISNHSKSVTTQKFQYIPKNQSYQPSAGYDWPNFKTSHFVKPYSYMKLPNRNNAVSVTQTNEISNGELTKNKNLLFDNKLIEMRNPTPLFLQMKKIKQQNQTKLFIRKRKLRKTRQNWILNNLYHKQEQIQIQPPKLQSQTKTRQNFNQTKQNIFPNSNLNY